MQNTTFENPSVRAVNRDKSYWRELITAWQKSNESQKDFCDRMNIKLGTFAHWRGIFAKENKKSENKFIALEVTSPVENKLDHFIIECPSGHKIVFALAIKTEQAQQIFKLLGLII